MGDNHSSIEITIVRDSFNEHRQGDKVTLAVDEIRSVGPTSNLLFSGIRGGAQLVLQEEAKPWPFHDVEDVVRRGLIIVESEVDVRRLIRLAKARKALCRMSDLG